MKSTPCPDCCGTGRTSDYDDDVNAWRWFPCCACEGAGALINCADCGQGVPANTDSARCPDCVETWRVADAVDEAARIRRVA